MQPTKPSKKRSICTFQSILREPWPRIARINSQTQTAQSISHAEVVYPPRGARQLSKDLVWSLWAVCSHSRWLSCISLRAPPAIIRMSPAASGVTQIVKVPTDSQPTSSFQTTRLWREDRKQLQSTPTEPKIPSQRIPNDHPWRIEMQRRRRSPTCLQAAPCIRRHLRWPISIWWTRQWMRQRVSQIYIIRSWCRS